jgi:hypothetical protein
VLPPDTKIFEDFHEPGQGSEGPSNFHDAFLSGYVRERNRKSGVGPSPRGGCGCVAPRAAIADQPR